MSGLFSVYFAKKAQGLAFTRPRPDPQCSCAVHPLRAVFLPIHPFGAPSPLFLPSSVLSLPPRSSSFSAPPHPSFSYPPQSSEMVLKGLRLTRPALSEPENRTPRNLAQLAPATKLPRRTLVEGFPAHSCSSRGGKLRRTSRVLSGAPLGLPDTNTIGLPRGRSKPRPRFLQNRLWRLKNA